jgi:Tol biopolymer transport system component
MRARILAAIATGLVTAGLAVAVPVPVPAQVRPNARYETLETAHFRVTFGPGLETLAARTAEIAERTRAVLVDLTVAPKGKVDILLVDDVDFSNGFANVFPSNRVVLYARPPIDDEALGYNADWLELVVSHELVHIYHLDRAGLLGRMLRTVFGRLPLVFPLFPAVATPEWSTEGLAVDVESAFTGFGRVHGSHHEMVVRTAALEGELDRMDRLNESSPIWPGDGRVYIYGSLFMHWLAERYGAEVHRRLLDRTASAVLPPFLFFDQVAKRAFGESFDDAYAAWRSEVVQSAARLADSLRAQGLTVSDRLTTHPRRALFPRVSADGQRLAYTAEDGRNSPETRILDAQSGRELESHRRNGVGGQSWTPGGGLIVSQFEFQNPYEIRSDLWLLGADSRRLTNGLRLQDGEVARDGERLVAIQNDVGGARLVLGRVSTGEVRAITDADPDLLWSFPRWSPDGTRIAATRWHRGGDFEIVIVDTTATVLTTIIRGPHMHLSPAWSPDGRWVLFSSDRTGITNLYAADVSGTAPELRQITNVLTGAFQPEVSPDQQSIYFAGYHAAGYAIERMAFAPSSWRTPMAERVRVVSPPASPAPNGSAPAVQQPARPYSPWRSLLPKAWQPVLLTGAGRYGGLTIEGEDLVGRHSFGAFAAVHLGGEGRWQGSATYRFARLGNPVLTLEASRYWDDLGQVTLPDSSRTSVLERSDQLGALLTFSRRRWRNAASLSVGIERERLVRSLENAPNFRLRDVEDTQLGLLARANFSTTRVPLFAVSREDGFSLSLSGRHSVESEATVYRDSTGAYPGDYNEGRALMTAYKSLPFGGFAHHVLAFRASGYVSDGPGASLSGLGGSTGSVSSILGFQLASGTRLLPVRGFGTSVLAGTRAWSASAEWRIPIALVGRRPAISPLFIDRVAGALFVDAGDAWCTPEERTASARCRFAEAVATPIAAAGGEIAIDVGFAGIFAARLRGGVGVPFRGPREGARLYFELGSNY